jgi:hypothetical protein
MVAQHPAAAGETVKVGLAANFKRTVDVRVAQATTGPAIRAFIAAAAERNVAELVASGSASPLFRRFVDGVENAPNESVRINTAGTGIIRYQFSSMSEAAAFALNFAVTHSPRLSGEYADSWFLLVDTKPWTGDLRSLPLGAEVTLTNNADYHRKVDVGGMRMKVAPQIVEQTRQAVMRKYPGITAERIFITIPGGYVLKGRAVRSGLSYDKKTKRFFQREAPRTTRRSDARKGEIMTYPSLAMYEKI